MPPRNRKSFTSIFSSSRCQAEKDACFRQIPRTSENVSSDDANEHAVSGPPRLWQLQISNTGKVNRKFPTNSREDGSSIDIAMRRKEEKILENSGEGSTKTFVPSEYILSSFTFLSPAGRPTSVARAYEWCSAPYPDRRHFPASFHLRSLMVQPIYKVPRFPRDGHDEFGSDSN